MEARAKCSRQLGRHNATSQSKHVLGVFLCGWSTVTEKSREIGSRSSKTLEAMVRTLTLTLSERE